MPKLIPRPPIASAPISRIVPERLKNQRELPMKSKVQWRRLLVTPSALGREIARVRPIVPRIARVAATAVNSETRTPMPSVSANPCTSDCESTNRMNAAMNVTTLASMIAPRPRR